MNLRKQQIAIVMKRLNIKLTPNKINKLTISACLSLFMGLFLSASVTAETLRLATTTSTENSGLLAYLLPELEKDTGIKVDYTAIGTGQALRLGKLGKVDVLLVHAPASESKFVREGWGVGRYPVMRNDFLIVGPKSDPAEIKESKNLSAVFMKISKGKAPFVSRGDQSGTHKKEKHLWNKHALLPIGAKWYYEAGLNMKKTLIKANEEQGYTLIDRGTWLAHKDNYDLIELYSGHNDLMNIYSIILINSERHEINIKESSAFLDWFLSDKGREMIGNYKINNQTLFTPIVNN